MKSRRLQGLSRGNGRFAVEVYTVNHRQVVAEFEADQDPILKYGLELRLASSEGLGEGYNSSALRNDARICPVLELVVRGVLHSPLHVLA